MPDDKKHIEFNSGNLSDKAKEFTDKVNPAFRFGLTSEYDALTEGLGKRDSSVRIYVPKEISHMISTTARQLETSVSDTGYRCLLVGLKEITGEKYKDVINLAIQDKDRKILKGASDIMYQNVKDFGIVVSHIRELQRENIEPNIIIKHYINPLIKSWEEIKDIDLSDFIDELNNLADKLLEDKKDDRDR